MDDHEVLQHLLDLESQAAALVDDAQTEADRRVSEGENQNRIRYDEAISGEIKTLEESCVKEYSAVKEDYRKQLEAYRESLKEMSLNVTAFSSLAEKLLLAAVPHCEGP